VREYFADELRHLWADFVGDTPELDKKGWSGDFLPDADLAQEVHARKEEDEKVLAFKPLADNFLDQQHNAIEEYVAEHIDYLKGLLEDKVGSGIGQSRAEIVTQLADELNLGPDEPPALLVSLYLVKHSSRLKI
jgi:hypothetical protein